MIQKTIFLLMNIYILGILVGCSLCNAAEMDKSVGAQVESQDLNLIENTTLTVNPYLAFYHSKCILSESTDDEEQSGISFIKISPVHTVTFYNLFFDSVERSKPEKRGQLDGNIIPVQNMSRNILFHSLQINH